MSISYNVYFTGVRPISREEIASRCQELHWAVLMRDPSAPYGTGKLVKPTGNLSNNDCFYGADSRRVSEPELEAAVMGNRLQVLWDTSGGEAIVAIKPDFDIHEVYDDDGLEELSETNVELVKRMRTANVHVEFMGGAYFVLQLSQAVAEIGRGIWEDPQSGDWELK